MLEIMVENISNGPKVKMDLATSSIISKFPLVPDLWEAKMVEVCTSGIGEHAGQGTVIQNQFSDSEIYLEPVCCKKRQKKSQPRNWFGE